MDLARDLWRQASKDAKKIEMHKEVWSETQRRLAEQAQERELEDVLRPAVEG